MALVKTSSLAAKTAAKAPRAPAATVFAPPKPGARRSQDRARVRQQKAAERIGAATEQLAGGMSESAAAAEQLRRSLEQISAGAEEAAGAAQESLHAIGSLGTAFTQARTEAEASRRRIELVQTIVEDSTRQIADSIAAIVSTSERQAASVEIIGKLEQQAASIGETTLLVADISDRTNLVALNAAIEAARAGDSGRGFAVVAEEVRGLAEIAERSAREVRERSGQIGEEVRALGERMRETARAGQAQVASARVVTDDLAGIRDELGALSASSEVVLTAGIEADIAAREAGKGAQIVASAAEQQSAAAAEAQRAVQQQSQSLEQSQQAAQALAELAEDMQGGTLGGGEQVGSAAEELSATVQQLSGAAGEILLAIEEISRGAQAQAAATQETDAAMGQIERRAVDTERSARAAFDRTTSIGGLLQKNRAAVTAITEAFAGAMGQAKAAIATLDLLEGVARAIERSINRIGSVAVQTSMLSVSGSVEAARAGDAGRGFAVVSSDIRALARDAADNIESVGDVVRLIQLQIANVRRDVEAVSAASEAELVKNRGIVERIVAIEADIAAIGRGNGEILKGAQNALNAVKEVLGGTQQIAAAAQQASNAATQAATAARQQSRGAEDLAAAIEEIASLADEMQASES